MNLWQRFITQVSNEQYCTVNINSGQHVMVLPDLTLYSFILTFSEILRVVRKRMLAKFLWSNLIFQAVGMHD